MTDMNILLKGGIFMKFAKVFYGDCAEDLNQQIMKFLNETKRVGERGIYYRKFLNLRMYPHTEYEDYLPSYSAVLKYKQIYTNINTHEKIVGPDPKGLT